MTTTLAPTHTLSAWHTFTAGDHTKVLWRHIAEAIIHAYDEDDDIAEALVLVKNVLARAAAHQKIHGASSWKFGLVVSAEEFAAIKLVLEDACDYMIVNEYAADESFPEAAAAARALGNGSVAWWEQR